MSATTTPVAIRAERLFEQDPDLAEYLIALGADQATRLMLERIKRAPRPVFDARFGQPATTA